jgi:hypothetical protein
MRIQFEIRHRHAAAGLRQKRLAELDEVASWPWNGTGLKTGCDAAPTAG